MRFCYFLLWQPARGNAAPAWSSAAHGALLRELGEWRASVPTLTRLIVHTPTEANDRYSADHNGPGLTLQCYFDELATLEAAAAPAGALARLLSLAAISRWAGPAPLIVEQQALAVRQFAMDGDAAIAPPPPLHCTFQVAYRSDPSQAAPDAVVGSQANPQANSQANPQANPPTNPLTSAQAEHAFDRWLADYIEHHVPLLKRQPGLLGLEVYTRIDWLDGLGLPRADVVQRNKVVFPDAATLTAALHSPARDALREHSQAAPKLPGGSNTHFPMRSDVIG